MPNLAAATVLAALCVSWLSTGLRAQTPELLANLGTDVLGVDSNPAEFTEIAPRQYLFVATTLERGRELWMTDGTIAGTRLFADLDPGPDSSNPDLLTPIAGGKIVFRAASRLWSTDGDPRNTRAIGIEPLEFAETDRLVPSILFRGDNRGDEELWATDGTVGGTVQLADIDRFGSSQPRDLYTVHSLQTDGTLRQDTFFTARTASDGRELYRFDGSRVVQLIDLAPGSVSGFDDAHFAHFAPTGPSPLSQFALVLWFRGFERAVGFEPHRFLLPFSAPERIELVADLEPGAAGSDPTEFVGVDNQVYFAATQTGVGRELWRQIALSSGPTLVADAMPGPLGSSPHQLTRFDTVFPFFRGVLCVASGRQGTVSTGREPWFANFFGMQQLANLAPGGFSSDPEFLVVTPSLAFFSADADQNVGRELYVTDGSQALTGLTHEFIPGAPSGNPTEAIYHVDTAGREQLIVSARGPGSLGVEPMLYDIQLRQSAPLADVQPFRDEGSRPARWFENPQTGEQWFFATTSRNGRELWRTDGTPGGTQLIVDLSPTTASTPEFDVVFTDDGRGWFVHDDGVRGRELWVSNGVGAQLAHDIAPGAASSNPSDLCALGLSLAWAADDGVHGRELYIDGQLSDLIAGPVGSAPEELTRAGNLLFFSAEDAQHGRELWRGLWRARDLPRPRQLFRVRDIRPGPLGSDPRHLVAHRSRCMFTADDGVHGREPWRSTGFGSSTEILVDVNPGPGDGVPGPLVTNQYFMIFAGDDGVHGLEPWASNGFPGASNRMLFDVRPGPLGSEPAEFTMGHVDRFAFRADDGVHGEELFWARSIDTAPTLLDLDPGPAASRPRGLLWTSSNLHFSAEDAAGREPWIAETLDYLNPHRLGDIRPGSASSLTAGDRFGVAGRYVVFGADDGSLGDEPWRVSAGGVGRPVGSGCGNDARTVIMQVTEPVLGQQLQVNGTGSPSFGGMNAYLLLSFRPLAALPLYQCAMQLDFNSSVPFGVVGTSGSWVLGVPLPSASNLIGVPLRLQAVVGPSDEPYWGLDITNGIELRARV